MKKLLLLIVGLSFLINAAVVIYKIWNDPNDLIKITLVISTIIVILCGIMIMLVVFISTLEEQKKNESVKIIGDRK